MELNWCSKMLIKDKSVVDIKEVNYLVFYKMRLGTMKTYTIIVVSKRSGEPLCRIRWWGAWWQYIMETFVGDDDGVVFNTGCLKDIIDYINELVEERKINKR